MPHIWYGRYLIYIIGIFSRLNAAAFCWIIRHKANCRIFMIAYLLFLLPMSFVVVLIPVALEILWFWFILEEWSMRSIIVFGLLC